LGKRKSSLILYSIVAVILVVSAALLGQSGNRDDEPVPDIPATSDIRSGTNDDDSIVLRAVVMMNEDEYARFSEMTKNFADSRSDLDIVLVNLAGEEAYDKLKNAARMGEAPDMMLIPNEWVREFAALGFLQPLDEYLIQEEDHARIDVLTNQVKWNGYQWGIPKDADPYILAWNRDTAARFGFDAAPQSVSDLVLWNETMSHPEEGQYGIWLDTTDPLSFIALTSSLIQAWSPSDRVWNDAEADRQELAAFLTPLAGEWDHEHFASHFPVPSGEFAPWDLLESGQMGAMVTTVSQFKSHPSDKIAIAAIPTTDTVWLKGRSYTLSSRTSHAELVMEWIREMTAPEAEIKLWEAARMLPAQIQSFQLEPLHSDSHIRSYDWLLSIGKTLPSAVEMPERLLALKSELNRLRSGEIDLAEFMQRVEAAWTVEKGK